MYNKLVRDNIPDIIKKNGATPIVRILDDEEYFKELNRKLKEELNEYLDGDNDVRIAVRQKNGVMTAKNLSVGVEEIIELSRVTYFGFYSEKMKPLADLSGAEAEIFIPRVDVVSTVT